MNSAGLSYLQNSALGLLRPVAVQHWSEGADHSSGMGKLNKKHASEKQDAPHSSGRAHAGPPFQDHLVANADVVLTDKNPEPPLPASLNG